MSVMQWFTPHLIVKNVSQKDVRVLGTLTIKAGETVDVYGAIDPPDVSAALIEQNLEAPWGDLYREVEIKLTLEIVSISLVGWNYSKVRPTNIAVPQGSPNQVLSLDSDLEFQWINASAPSVVSPLQISESTISIPKASVANDGYLSKEDWLLFSSAATGKPDQKIWQYQDFGAPVASTLTLNIFQNGTGLAFNASYILDGTAQIVLSSNTSVAPTTTTSAPAKWLPSNRVSVSSHIGTTVVLNQAPAASLGCRVFFLVSVPAATPLPNDYQEDPEFSNEAASVNLDENYVNQNQDESIYGTKTFENATRFNGNVGINKSATTALDVDGTIKTVAFELSTSPSDGYVLTSNSAGIGTWKPATGLKSTDHEAVNSLVHNLAENSFEEIIYSGSTVSSVIVWTNSSKEKKIREGIFTYLGSQATQELNIQYDDSGVEVHRVTTTYQYSGPRVVSSTAVKA